MLEILDLKLFGVKTLVLILIEPSLATIVLLEATLTIELLIKHILIGFTKFKSETWFKIVCKPNIYLNINVDLDVEGVLCSPWQLNL